ncbi:MAG: protein kinase [Gammaproteobacteria bacterium]|nr:protein kinase [Gammaproteobacteria bacterium]
MRHEVTSKNPSTFIGYINGPDGRITQNAPDHEWEKISLELAGKPSGTKSLCSEDGGPIGYAREMVQLPRTHTFIIINKIVYAVSSNDPAVLISRDGDEDKLEGISASEWDFVQSELQDKDNHSKSRHRKRLLIPGRMFDAIIIEGIIYIIGGQDHAIHGGSSKIKFVETKEGKLFTLKIPHKYYIGKPDSNSSVFLKNEAEISQELNIFIFCGKKQKNAFPFFLMPYFEFSFYVFFKEKIVIDYRKITNSDDQIKKKELFLRQTLSAALKTTILLTELHKKNVIHRDIKPDNLLMNIDPQTNEIEVMIADLGLALKTQNVYAKHVTHECAGTLSYLPPEFFNESANGKIARDAKNLKFSFFFYDKTDIYAWGFTLRQVYSILLKEIKLEIPLLLLLSTMMREEIPENRLSLSYLRITLAFFLFGKENIKPTAPSIAPLVTKTGVQCIFKLINEYGSQFPEQFSNDKLIGIIVQLEKDLLLADKEEKTKYIFSYIEADLKNTSFTPEKLKWIFVIYNLPDEFNLNTNFFKTIIKNLFAKQDEPTDPILFQSIAQYHKNKIKIEDLQKLTTLGHRPPSLFTEFGRNKINFLTGQNNQLKNDIITNLNALASSALTATFS